MNWKVIIWKYLIPGGVALLMVFACFFYWNARFTFGFGDAQIKRISMLKSLLFTKERPHGEVLPVNVSYDRMLVPYADELGIPAGDLDITDRADLLCLMDSLQRWDNYRYIVCDVHFDTTITTGFDSLLYTKMASMRDIVIASSDHDPSLLEGKTACAEYDQLEKGNRFIKFRYFALDGGDSVPLRMWEEIDGGQLVRKGNRYRWNGLPAVNSSIPDLEFFPVMGWDDKGEKQIWNLGADILDAPLDMAPLFEDKIVLLGDWAEYDMHATIRGSMPGTDILYNAYLALKDGAVRVRAWVLLILFLTFMAEISWVLRFYWGENPGKDRMSAFAAKNPLLHALWRIVASWIGYTGPLWIVCTVIYLTCGFFVNAFVVGSAITFVAPYLKKKPAE